jgi:hypothetical protein
LPGKPHRNCGFGPQYPQYCGVNTLYPGVTSATISDNDATISQPNPSTTRLKMACGAWTGHRTPNVSPWKWRKILLRLTCGSSPSIQSTATVR